MSEAGLGVRLEKTPVEALQQPGPLAAGTPGGGGHGSLQQKGSTEKSGQQHSRQGLGRRDWLKAGTPPGQP